MKKLLLLVFTAIALTGCQKKSSGSSFKEVGYEEFNKQALEAYQLNNGYTTAILNGSINASVNGEQIKFNDAKVEHLENGHVTENTTTDADNQEYAIFAVSYSAKDVPAPKDYESFGYNIAVKYYVSGNGFKLFVNYDNGKASGRVNFNKYGLVTVADADGAVEGTIKIQWQ